MPMTFVSAGFGGLATIQFMWYTLRPQTDNEGDDEEASVRASVGGLMTQQCTADLAASLD